MSQAGLIVESIAVVKLSAFADEIAAEPTAQLDCLAEHGVRHVELRSVFGINVLDLSDTQHQQFLELLLSRDMALSAIGSPIGKIPITDPFDPHLVRFAKAIEVAHFYGTPRIRVFSFYTPEGGDRAAHRDETIRRMRALADTAVENNVQLVLENEKGIYGDTPERVAEIIETIDSPALRHAFDPANYLEVGVQARLAWERVRHLVSHFHVKDYDSATHRNVPAGEGDGCIGELIADAVARGFDGFCVLEPHLIVAEKSYGFTGPERFGDAAHALKRELEANGVAYR